MTGRIQDKIAIVTGGASGIGEATARLFAKEGATVAIADRNFERAQMVAEEITAAGGQAKAWAVDMNYRAQIEDLIAGVAAEHGRIDILVNNAAAVHLSLTDLNVADMDFDIWDEIIRVNLTGPMTASKFTIPHMLRQGGGAIVMVSSMAYRLAAGYRAGYDSTKAGINALTRSIAVSFGKQGVRCNSVAPGLTLSPAVLRQVPAPMREVYADHTMSPSIGEPHHQASAILFLASDDAAYVNGAVLEVDGGLGAHLAPVPAIAKLQQ